MNERLSVEEVQQKTRELLGMPELDVSYITEGSIAADTALRDDDGADAEGVQNTNLWGNNTRYSTRVINGQTYSVYVFDHGGDRYNSAHACGAAKSAWARMDIWHHTYLGKCPNGREKWRFDR